MAAARVLFQIYLEQSQTDVRIPILREYSNAVHPGVQTCANLSLVLLGLVEPGYYLQSCKARGVGTGPDEVREYIQSSLAQCGVADTSVVLTDSRRVQAEPDPRKYLRGLLEITSQHLRPQHATILGMDWVAGGGHAVVLAKDAQGELRYIDPSITMEQGGQRLFPFIAVGYDDIIEHLFRTLDRLKIFETTTYITQEQSLAGTCMTTRAPMLMEGGRVRRSRLTRLTRKNGKKTKKSRKQHGVRTHRRRH